LFYLQNKAAAEGLQKFMDRHIETMKSRGGAYVYYNTRSKNKTPNRHKPKKKKKIKVEKV